MHERPAGKLVKVIKFRPGIYDSTTDTSYTLTSHGVNSLPIGEQLNRKNSYVAYSGIVEKKYRLTSREIDALSNHITNELELLETIDVINTRGENPIIFDQRPHPTITNALVSQPKKLSRQDFYTLLQEVGIYEKHAQLKGVSGEEYLHSILTLTPEEVHAKILQGASNLQELTAAILEAAKLMEHLKTNDDSLNF